MKKNWIHIGAVFGIIASLSYPICIIFSLPVIISLLLVILFGVSISISAVGLYHFISLNRTTVTLQIGTVSNIVAGIFITCMLLVQMSVNAKVPDLLDRIASQSDKELLTSVWHIIDQIQLGLDMCWDVYLIIGTILIAWNMRLHPRFGRLFCWTGIGIATILAIFNFSAFPETPVQAGSIDFGPVAGLWFLAATIQYIRSLKWANSQLMN